MNRLACALLLFLIAAAPAAPDKKAAPFTGIWLTDLGLMELEQSGNDVKGAFALRGTSSIEGTATGNKLEFTYKAFKSGKGSFQARRYGWSFFDGWFHCPFARDLRPRGKAPCARDDRR